MVETTLEEIECLIEAVVKYYKCGSRVKERKVCTVLFLLVDAEIIVGGLTTAHEIILNHTTRYYLSVLFCPFC